MLRSLNNVWCSQFVGYLRDNVKSKRMITTQAYHQRQPWWLMMMMHSACDGSLVDPNMVILSIYGTKHHSQRPLGIAFENVFFSMWFLPVIGRKHIPCISTWGASLLNKPLQKWRGLINLNNATQDAQVSLGFSDRAFEKQFPSHPP